jgi:hypothetical protein
LGRNGRPLVANALRCVFSRGVFTPKVPCLGSARIAYCANSSASSSPDGSHLTFYGPQKTWSDSDPNCFDVPAIYVEPEVYVINADGTGSTRITDYSMTTPGYSEGPNFPDWTSAVAPPPPNPLTLAEAVNVYAPLVYLHPNETWFPMGPCSRAASRTSSSVRRSTRISCCCSAPARSRSC